MLSPRPHLLIFSFALFLKLSYSRISLTDYRYPTDRQPSRNPNTFYCFDFDES